MCHLFSDQTVMVGREKFTHTSTQSLQITTSYGFIVSHSLEMIKFYSCFGEIFFIPVWSFISFLLVFDFCGSECITLSEQIQIWQLLAFYIIFCNRHPLEIFCEFFCVQSKAFTLLWNSKNPKKSWAYISESLKNP